MATHRLVHSTHGAGTAAMLGVTALLALAPLTAWTEERARILLDGEERPLESPPVEPPPGVMGSLEAFVVPIRPVQALVLDEPWRAPDDAAAPGDTLEAACTPWNGAGRCSNESALLTDPWSAEAVESANVREPSRSDDQGPPEPAPALDPLTANLEPSPPAQRAADWPDLYGEPTRLPTAAEVWAHQPPAVDATVTAPAASPTAGPLDGLIVDPGVPETPF